MITTLRQSLKSNAYRIFLWMFLIVMIIGGVSFDFTDRSQWAIKAYNQKMMLVEWYHALVNAQKQIDYIASLGINWPRAESVEKEVLRNSLKKLLLKHNALDLKLVTPAILMQDHVAQTLQHLPAHFFDAKGNLNIAMLERQLAPLNFESFLDEIEQEIKSNFIYNLVDLSSSYISKFEIQSQLHKDYAHKEYSVIQFSLQDSLEKVKKNKVEDEVLEKFYKKSEHADAYKTAEKRAGLVWKFNAKDYGLNISDKEISAYYDEHKKNQYVQTPSKMQVHRIFMDDRPGVQDDMQAIYNQVKENPALFADLVKKISSEKVSGKGAQTTDFFDRSSTKYPELVVAAAFEQLHQDFDISDIIKTDTGYEIIQRVSRKSAVYKPLSQVKQDIYNLLLDKKFTQRFQQDAQRLINQSEYNQQAIVTFIEKRKGVKESLGLTARNQDVISMHLFQTDLDHYVVFMNEKEGVLLQCTQIVKKSLKPFSEIKSIVMADYYKKQAEQDLKNVVMQALQESDHMSMKELAEKYHGRLLHAQASYKDNKHEYSDILQKPEISQHIKDLDVVGQIIDIAHAQESFLIRLDALEPIEENIVQEKAVYVKNVLESKSKYIERDSFIASLYRRAKLKNKIEIKDQLLKDAKETV